MLSRPAERSYTTFLLLGTKTHLFAPNKPRPLDSKNKGGRVASRDQGRGRQKEKKWPREVRESVRTKKVSRDLVPAIMKL